MDIPNSGAIFTLGKSYLAENTQSYFYIKNDPVKRLISGSHQSAVICESGRLFVWGENHYGQLGIGGHGVHHNNNNNNNNGNDIISKPTCVKSLKTLGLKACDAAFGKHWAVILTFSNEIFFTGRNIFPSDTPVASNFTPVLLDNEEYGVVRKPFRLEEFDDYLSKSEETDNFVAVRAGNEHFAVLTTTGRLIGCGSNASQQLGELEEDYDGHPVEIVLDAPVKQFVCGPESTLVLTESGNLYLTGRLNEFVFPKFTELQKNLSAAEQIIFMHISKRSDIYIVTTLGNIYRSYESLRNKSLVFQRFYDYDSEENGPIWKLLKGFSFYAVLTKANKFFTTFSESGHHLKTFREISKFKNLRLVDIAVGDQHILVHGIPRNAALSASIIPPGIAHSPYKFALKPAVPSMDKAATLAAAAVSAERTISGRSLRREANVIENAAVAEQTMAPSAPPHEMEATMDSKTEIETRDDELNNNNKPGADVTEAQQQEKPGEIKDVKEEDPNSEEQKLVEQNGNNQPEENTSNGAAETELNKNVAELITSATEEAVEQITQNKIVSDNKSPTGSVHSRKSIKFEAAALEKSTSSPSTEISLRPRTPFPSSSNTSTPQTLKKTPMRNFSYEAAVEHDHIDRTSPELVDSLETVEENVDAEQSQAPAPVLTTISTPTPPTEDDEQLTVEITTTKDSQDSTKEINEIRFINNGIDVTENVRANMPDSPLKSSTDDLESESENGLLEVEEHIDKITVAVKEKSEEMGQAAAKEVEKATKEMEQTAEAVEKEVGKMGEELMGTVSETSEKASDSIGDKIESKLSETRDSVQTAMRNAVTGARESFDAAGENAKRMASDAVDAVGDNARRMATGAREAVDAVGENAKRMANNAIKTVEEAGSNAAKAADETKEAMKNAVGNVTNKISNEMQEAKQNISSLFQIKSVKEAAREQHDDDAASKYAKANNTNGSGGEDDERTTASVNSTHTSAGNPFESNGMGSGNPFESTTRVNAPIDDLDAIVERGKKAMQEDLRRQEQERLGNEPRAAKGTEQEVEQASKSRVRQFFEDVRNKGLSCRSEKAIQIDDEPPPHYTKNKVNSEISLHNGHGHGEQNTSRVCTIL